MCNRKPFTSSGLYPFIRGPAYALASLALSQSNHETRKQACIDEIVLEAKTRLAHHKRRQPELVHVIDNSVLIIEDDGGSLWYHEGDLSFLMDSPPVILKSFAKQLKADIQEDYKEHQQAVWRYEVKDGEPFITPCGRQAAIFPIFLKGMCFTVTVFYFGTGPDVL